MPFQSKNGIRYFTFETLGENIVQAIFTRQGGVSRVPYESLNVGGTVGDEVECVRENRLRIFAALDRRAESAFDAWQVHGTKVVIADAPRPPDVPHEQADAILTDQPSVTLFMRFADCVPIFLQDPVRQVVGLVHAGWKGTVLGTVRIAIRAMHDHYGTDPADLLAAIGPSIGPDHYEVGPEVVAQVEQAFGADSPGLLSSNHHGQHFDLWAANRLWLEREGIRQIEVAGVCTACHTDDWFSHRAEHGRTGRFGAILALVG